MKYLTFAFVALSTFSAFASTPDFEPLNLTPAAGSSKFEQLISYYNEGQKPQESDLAGLRTGREYTKDAPNQATPAYLVCQRYSNTNDGPLFSGPFLGCANYGQPSGSATLYDDGLSKSDYDSALTGARAVSIDLNAKDVCYNNTNQMAPKWQGIECYRQYGTYLIYIVKSLQDGSVLRTGYFFKKVSVNN